MCKENVRRTARTRQHPAVPRLFIPKHDPLLSILPLHDIRIPRSDERDGRLELVHPRHLEDPAPSPLRRDVHERHAHGPSPRRALLLSVACIPTRHRGKRKRGVRENDRGLVKEALGYGAKGEAGVRPPWKGLRELDGGVV